MSSSNSNEEKNSNEENNSNNEENKEDSQPNFEKGDYLELIDQIFLKTQEYNEFIESSITKLKEVKKLDLTKVFSEILDNKIDFLENFEKKIEKVLRRIYNV